MKKNLKLLVSAALVALTFLVPVVIYGTEKEDQKDSPRRQLSEEGSQSEGWGEFNLVDPQSVVPSETSAEREQRLERRKQIDKATQIRKIYQADERLAAEMSAEEAAERNEIINQSPDLGADKVVDVSDAAVDNMMAEMMAEMSIIDKAKDKEASALSYDADIDEGAKDAGVPKGKKYRKRLFLGEADFSCTAALLKKHSADHPELGKFITATELETKKKLKQTYKLFTENQKFLKTRGVRVYYNIDAREVHEYFKGDRYPRIHFNFPHDKSNMHAQTLPTILRDFFLSASKLQEVNDRIYVALAQPLNKEDFYQGYIYNIYDAAYGAGYKLFKKHPSPLERYGYEHRQTGNDSSVGAAEVGKEFIFIKQSLPVKKVPRTFKTRFYYGKTRNLLPSIKTDDESSNYSSASEEEQKE